MKVVLVYEERCFWTAVFANGTELTGFLEHDKALNAKYNEYLVICKTNNSELSDHYSWHKSPNQHNRYC